tara:strand:- start:388 stop:963 length:576 start_codon:yes stop_codon:yes gene_type:complete
MSDSIPSKPLSQRLGGRNLYLVGMMGSGKSVTGPKLAKELNYRFVDSDQVIEQLSKKSIPEIFENEGENAFRELETKVLQSIGQHYSLVVSTGGGVVTQSKNWGVLHQGIVIWLDPGRERLLKRLKDDSFSRPLLQNKEPLKVFDELYLKREPLYRESDLHIEIKDESPEEVTSSILMGLPSIIIDQEAQV